MAYGYIPSPLGKRLSSVEIAKAAKLDKSKSEPLEEKIATRTPTGRTEAVTREENPVLNEHGIIVRDKIPDPYSVPSENTRLATYQDAKMNEGYQGQTVGYDPDGRAKRQKLAGSGDRMSEDEPVDKSEPPTGFEDPSDAMHTPMGRAREDGSNRYPVAPSGSDMVDYEDYEGSSALPVEAMKDPSARAKAQADAKMVAQANADPKMNPDKMAGLRLFQGRDENSKYSGNKYSVDRIGKSDSEPVEEPESAPVVKSINQMIYDRTYGKTPYSIKK